MNKIDELIEKYKNKIIELQELYDRNKKLNILGLSMKKKISRKRKIYQEILQDLEQLKREVE